MNAIQNLPDFILGGEFNLTVAAIAKAEKALAKYGAPVDGPTNYESKVKASIALRDLAKAQVWNAALSAEIDRRKAL